MDAQEVKTWLTGKPTKAMATLDAWDRTVDGGKVVGSTVGSHLGIDVGSHVGSHVRSVPWSSIQENRAPFETHVGPSRRSSGIEDHGHHEMHGAHSRIADHGDHEMHWVVVVVMAYEE